MTLHEIDKNSPEDEQRARVGRFFWFQWALASAVGSVAGIALGSVVGLAVVDAVCIRFGSPFLHIDLSDIVLVYDIVGAVVTGAVAGTFVGITQWLVLRRQISRIGWWVLASIVGWTVAVGWAAFAFKAVLELVFKAMHPRLGVVVAIAIAGTVAGTVAGAVIGAVVGIVQWIVLRRWTRRAGRWAMASTLGWAVGLAVSCVVAIVTTKFVGSSTAVLTGLVAIRIGQGYLYAEPLGSALVSMMIGQGYFYAEPLESAWVKSVEPVGLVVTGLVVGAVTGIAMLSRLSTICGMVVNVWKNADVLSRLSLVVGAALLTLGLGLGLYVLSLELEARILDSGWSLWAASPCLHPGLALEADRRVIREKDSEVVTVIVSNDTPEECEVAVAIYASSFDVSPSSGVQTCLLPPHEAAIVSWVVTPKEMGTHSISVSCGLQSRSIGITVTDVMGLTAQQARLLSYVSTFFSPALTLPWLYNTWRQYRKEKEEKKREQEIEYLKRQVEELKAQQKARKWWQFWK